MTKWMFKKKEVTSVPDGAEGFVYIITNEDTGMYYVGRKSFHRRHKKKIAGESNWKNYRGSSRYLTRDLKEQSDHNWSYEILMICPSRQELNYQEIKYQIDLKCLETDMCYNRNLGATKVYRGPGGFAGKNHSDETKKKISDSQSGPKGHNFTGYVVATCLKTGVESEPMVIPSNTIGSKLLMNGIEYTPSNINSACRRYIGNGDFKGLAKGHYKGYRWDKIKLLGVSND